MKIFPLLLILFLLTIESQNMSARAEGDSLRIARPVFLGRQENSVSQLFISRLQCYAHPAVCMMALCHGSCGARADACQIPSRAVLNLAHPGSLLINEGCGGSDECTAQSQVGTLPPRDLSGVSTSEVSTKTNVGRQSFSSGCEHPQSFNDGHAVNAPDCCATH